MADPPHDEHGDGTPDSDAFAPPRKPASPAIALEPEWERARADKQAAAAAPRPSAPAPRRRRGGGVAIVAILVIAGGIAAGVWLLHRRGSPRHARLPGIEIRVRAEPPVEIRIDGHRAGKTPLTLQRRAGTTPIRIDATIGGTVQTRVVVPDRDREVDF